MLWSLCLLCLAGGLRLTHGAPIEKTSMMEAMAAPREEVNVLMFGVIQLSESLNYVYETTEAKIARIGRALRSHEDTLQRLSMQTEQAVEVEQQMKEVVQLLQAQVVKQQDQTQTTRDQLSAIQKDEQEIKTKVKNIEMYLNSPVPTSLKELKERAADHSNILRGLQLLTQFQKDLIQTQDEQLSKLQKMSEPML